MPEISIIVPVYKVEKYIYRCIESILAQTFTDFELILVDDGSPDKSGEICDEYAKKDSRIHVIHKENGGVSAARNSGLDVAQGTYIMFCDSDDYVDNDWCQCLYDAITQNNAVMAVCGYKIISHDDAEMKCDTCVFENGNVPLKDWFSKWYSGAPWNKIYIRNHIETNNVQFSESINYAEDDRFIWDYFEACTANDFFTVTDAAPYCYRTVSGSLSHKYIENYWENERVFLARQISISKKLGTDLKKYENKINALYFYLIFKSIENLFSRQNHIGNTAKCRKLKEILSSDEYKYAVNSAEFTSIAAWFKFLLKHRTAPLLFLYYTLKN